MALVLALVLALALVLGLVLGLAQAQVQDSVPAQVRVLEQAVPDPAFPVRSPVYTH